MLGRFELRRILGQGAQSVVWLAFDPRLEREVAIKQMKLDQGADEATLDQWLQEARSVSRLTHPGIVPALAAAHSAGVVHRDLKPSNILIDSAGRARVMDFGIAVRIKETSSAGPVQGSATFGGTPGYLSPEAAGGLPATP